MNNETLLIRDSKGKKLCEIYFLWSWGFIGTRRVWTNIDSATKLAWHQALTIMLFFIRWQAKMFPLPNFWGDLIETMEENKSGFPCLACEKASIYPKKFLGRIVGFRCRNVECNMYNAFIPSKLLSYLYEMPIDLQKEFKCMILMNKGGSDKKHWGNYTILEVRDKWDEINDYIIQEARLGKDWENMLKEVGFNHQIRQ